MTAKEAVEILQAGGLTNKDIIDLYKAGGLEGLVELAKEETK